jgi:pilus assembly protein Flp/PilA
LKVRRGLSNDGEFEMNRVLENIRAFACEEDGIALTEYLVLLGLLVAGVIAAVGAAGGSLSGAWNEWGTFWDNSKAGTWPA